MSVDGTDFLIFEPSPFWTGWYSHKFNGPALRYEIAICIQTGQIVWVHGPFPAGAWSDISIFRHALKKLLEKGERVEADNGYGDEAVDRPYDKAYTAGQMVAKSQLRARHETVNRRFKQFNALQQRFRHDKEKHAHVFNAVAVITQISLANESPLFPVDYRSYNI